MTGKLTPFFSFQLSVTFLLFLIPYSQSTVYNLTPSTSGWQNTLQTLQAGDVANLDGTFTVGGSGYFQLNLTGTSTEPITIQGVGVHGGGFSLAAGQQQNVVNICGAWIIFRNLEITGGSKGLRLGTTEVSNSIFQDLKIHDTGSTAFSANDGGVTYSNITIQHNEIYNTGDDTSECFYLGCSYGGCVFQDSYVLNNYCHNTTLAQGGSEGSCIQVKSGSFNNLIRDNVCYDLRGPGILLYDDFDKGRNLVIGNLVINSQDNGIQVAAGATLVNNILANCAGSGIYLNVGEAQDFLPSKVYPRNLTLLHNTVINSTTSGIYFASWNAGNNFVFANNFVYSASGSAFNPTNSDMNGVSWAKNAYSGGSTPAGVTADGAFTVSALFDELENPSMAELNFYPTGTGHLPNAGAGGYSWEYDFNDYTRNSTAPTIGAYEFARGNPSVSLDIGFKEVTGSNTGTDVTPTDDGNTGTGNGDGNTGTGTAGTDAGDGDAGDGSDGGDGGDGGSAASTLSPLFAF